MKTPLLGCLLLLTLGSASASTVVLSGPLYGSGDPAFPSYADGGYAVTLSGTTLTYTISTRPVGQPVTPADYGILLGSTAGSIVMPFSSHFFMGMSGCRPIYGSERAISYYHPESGSTIPVEFIDPGMCDAYFQMSVFFGTLELTSVQMTAFSRPDFSVAVVPLGLQGRTSPDIVTLVPEPSAGVLLYAIAVAYSSRRQRPTKGEARLGNRWGLLLSSMIFSKSNIDPALDAQCRPGGVSA